MDDAVAGEAAEHGVGFGGRGGGCWGGWLAGGAGGRSGDGGLGGGGGSSGSGAGGSGRQILRCGRYGGALHAAVHGLIGEGVGCLVFVAEGVGDLEGVEAGDAVAGLLPEGFEVGGVDFVFALDLFDHEFGVGDDFEAAIAVVEGVLDGGEEAGVFGEVVGTDAEEFGEFGDEFPVGAGDFGSVAGGAGIASGATVAVGGDPGGGGVGGVEEAGCGGTGRHYGSLSEGRAAHLFCAGTVYWIELIS